MAVKHEEVMRRINADVQRGVEETIKSFVKYSGMTPKQASQWLKEIEAMIHKQMGFGTFVS